MLPRVFPSSTSLTIISMLFAALCCEYLRGGHPYVDRHFNLDSTPRYASYGSGMAGSHAESTSHSATCSNGTCGRNGSSGGNCPPVQNAILRLWVPDDATVEINGHPTRPQLLGGIHRGSRVYSLEGLYTDRVSPCEIVVCFGDHMNQQRFYREIPVQAGGHYQLRFPGDFERTSWTPEELGIPTINQFSDSEIATPREFVPFAPQSTFAPQTPYAPFAPHATDPISADTASANPTFADQKAVDPASVDPASAEPVSDPTAVDQRKEKSLLKPNRIP